MGNDLKKLLKMLEAEQGATVKPTRKGWMIYPPDKAKQPVTVHKTPSDRRAWANMISELRRSGFNV